MAASNKYSNFKIIHFPDKIQSFREGRITSPVYVRIKPINFCGDHCWWCVYHSPDHSKMHTDMEARDMIPLPKMLEILDDLHDMGVKAVTFSGGGEPLIHKDIVAIMERTVELGIDLSIITNGQQLSGERAQALSHAKWVRVSMDYSSGEELQKFRRTHPRFFEERLNNLKAFAAIKDADCDLYVNYIVHRENCTNLVYMARQLKDCGVENVRFSPMWVSPGFQEYHAPIREVVEAQLQLIQGFTDARFTVNTTYRLDDPAHSTERGCTRCLYMQVVPVIGADLGVYACHNQAYSAHGRIGSIRDRGFKDFWFSDEARARMEAINPSEHCRIQCANHSKVHLYNSIADASEDNFV